LNEENKQLQEEFNALEKFAESAQEQIVDLQQ
jgi:hypothetical protein